MIFFLMKKIESVLWDRISGKIKITALTKKYETTFAEIETQISETEVILSAMIDDFEGSEFDMLGLSEFKKLLGGVQND